MLNVNIKKLTPGDAGMDITATSKSYDDNGNVVYGTGLAFEIPDGYIGLLFPRSSNTKKDLLLGNSVGVLDSGYRGEVVFKFKPSQRYEEGFQVYNSDKLDSYIDAQYKIGDRIGQIIILPYQQVQFIEVDSLSDTERGTGSFGSTN
jgi:dUTP pyrophosphatase